MFAFGILLAALDAPHRLTLRGTRVSFSRGYSLPHSFSVQAFSE